ncbi:MAG: ankyrin repeat-containing protein [Paenibacillus sp.]|nr:ankyrin repeat-containing protein [Paenibacillus sp.]
MTLIPEESPLAVAVVDAIRSGDVQALKKLLADNPGLATARIAEKDADKGDKGSVSRTLLHVATDWPGHFTNGVKMVTVLIEAGADANARFTGPHTETPLHWAASCDDVEVLEVLLDAGAEMEADGAVIAGGTALDDAAAFGQWRAARRLVERGARTKLWHAAALGLSDRVESFFAGGTTPVPEEITAAFWQACHGGQQRTAEYLLEKGADIEWIGYGGMTALDIAYRGNADGLVEWLRGRGARLADEVRGS